ncbi:MAG: VCBS repeat-containing protein [Imperialibacter sp.]|uniref:VCBS repeat-containing protein n=1 Tax=Imperialibacter sp. TaxID=2038411 RepID=UPI0032EFE6C0
MKSIRSTFVYLILIAALLNACNQVAESPNQATPLFSLLDASSTGIEFNNELTYTEELNPYTFRNFFNGGGVGLGDVNNDGLIDVFFAGNLVDNKLYLNKGNFTFEDISDKAGIASSEVWTTGVSLVDINGDGWLDIYLCKSGPSGGPNRSNELLINDGDTVNGPHFTNQAAAYGIADVGLSVHAAFFDYDKDGDLDLYLLNNSIRTVGGYDLRKGQRNIPDLDGGNKLYRNDGGKFTNVSQQAGIYTSAIGFGLGVTIGDLNKDSWPDIYVSNDFFEKDYLYINNQDGTFTEDLESYIRELSMGSMGADMADINNDGLPEVFVTEMLPEDDARLKTTTQFEKWDKYQVGVEQGYYHQFSRNVLQLNNGIGPDGKLSFSEVSRLTGTHATDWSWGALIFDMDNDGLKDIFVANGIGKDLLDQDYVNFIGDPEVVRSILQQKSNVIKQLIDSIPSNKVSNYAFKNTGNLHFENFASQWGLALPSFSNGSAYGDLDNDGDLDLVLNNVNMPAFVYRNNTKEQHPENHSLTVSLRGEQQNYFAVGSKVTLFSQGQVFYQELSPMRGFMSSVDYRLHFGLGPIDMIDSLVVEWPNETISIARNLSPDKTVEFFQADAVKKPNLATSGLHTTVFTMEALPPGVDFMHVESSFVDFDKERLLFNMLSNEGPCTCVADINGDGQDDFYIGGAKGQSGRLFRQAKDGEFQETSSLVFDGDKEAEDTGCAFFDANGDNLPDLYVTSGSNEVPNISLALVDRLYINKGKGQFVKSQQILPTSAKLESTSVVRAMDYDNDGDNDLFVGVRMTPGFYGEQKNGYLLNNDGQGIFQNVTIEFAPDLTSIGMITDALWSDLDNDGAVDLVVVGDWMPIRVFLNRNGKFIEASDRSGLAGSSGWYHAVAAGDFNEDGLVDFVVGNHGLNSRFKASQFEPISMYINDFDKNGSKEQILTRYDGGKELPLVMRTDMVMQIPVLKKKYLRFKNYVGQGMDEAFTSEQISNSIILQVNDLSSQLLLNKGNGQFSSQPLPLEAQFAPVYSLLVEDFDNDGHLDVFLGGNQYRAKPETGIYDASYGLMLKGDGKGTLTSLKGAESGIHTRGEIRSAQKIKVGKQKMIVVGKNNDVPEFYSY